MRPTTSPGLPSSNLKRNVACACFSDPSYTCLCSITFFALTTPKCTAVIYPLRSVLSPIWPSALADTMLLFILSIYTNTEWQCLTNSVNTTHLASMVRDKLIIMSTSMFILPRRHRRWRWTGRWTGWSWRCWGGSHCQFQLWQQGRRTQKNHWLAFTYQFLSTTGRYFANAGEGDWWMASWRPYLQKMGI